MWWRIRKEEEIKSKDHAKPVVPISKLKSLILKVMHEELESHREKLINNAHLKSGDECVVNIYNLFGGSANSWDTGAKAIPMWLFTGKEIKDAIRVKINEVKIQEGLFYEYVDKVSDVLHDKILQDTSGRYKKLIYEINAEKSLATIDKDVKSDLIKDCNYIKNAKISYTGGLSAWKWGLYLGASFTIINHDISPSWYLNDKSFLNVNSEAGKLTIERWNTELKLEKELLNIEAEIESHKSKMITKMKPYRL